MSHQSEDPRGYNPSGLYDPDNSAPLRASHVPIAGPPPKKNLSLRWMTGSAIVLAAVIITTSIASVFVTPPQREQTPTPRYSPKPSTAKPSSSPSQPHQDLRPTPVIQSGMPLNCQSGGGYFDTATAGVHTSTGFGFKPPATWSQRFDRKQWPWLVNGAGTGRSTTQGSVGMIIGGVQKNAGFDSTSYSTQSVIGCILTYGIFGRGTTTEIEGKEVTISGFDGWQRDYLLTNPGNQTKTKLTILTLENADDAFLTMVIGFATSTDVAAETELATALSTLRQY